MGHLTVPVCLAQLPHPQVGTQEMQEEVSEPSHCLRHMPSRERTHPVHSWRTAVEAFPLHLPKGLTAYLPGAKIMDEQSNSGTM